MVACTNRRAPFEDIRCRFVASNELLVARIRKTSSQRIAESCVTINIIVIIMKLWNCRFSVIKSKEFVLLWIERREELEASTNELFNVVASGKVRI